MITLASWAATGPDRVEAHAQNGGEFETAKSDRGAIGSPFLPIALNLRFTGLIFRDVRSPARLANQGP